MEYANFKISVWIIGFLLMTPLMAEAGQTFTGAPVHAQKITMTISGKSVEVVKIGAYFHQMDLPPHARQPIGLEEFFFIQIDPQEGHAAKCLQWFDQVTKDERDWTRTQPTFPYLEFSVGDNAQPIDAGGVRVIRDQDIRCWEAHDFGPPLY